MVEELEDEGDAVGKDQVLRHELKLVDVVEAEVLEEEEQSGRDRLHQHLLVAVDVHAQLHALDHRHAADGREGGSETEKLRDSFLSYFISFYFLQ